MASESMCVTYRRASWVDARGKVRANLGDTMCDGIGVADLGGRILKWAKTDEKL